MCIFAEETAPSTTPLEAANLVQTLDCEHEVTVYIGVLLFSVIFKKNYIRCNIKEQVIVS